MSNNQAKKTDSEPLDLQDPCGPNIWESAEDAEIPDDHWEYHIRKANNDAAYNSLSYVPYCSTMPVQKACDDPRFMWKKKET